MPGAGAAIALSGNFRGDRLNPNPQQTRESKGLKSFLYQKISLFIFPIATSAFPVAASAFLAATSAFTFPCFTQPVAASAFLAATSAFTFPCFA
ncbi:MAG: hypothetical protein V7K89_28820 [Nostoc sp.]|uniref:hypothetical protein n=1 Tax=Nostoc sp. TaxID=1180 RepID=UPI002FF7E16C